MPDLHSAEEVLDSDLVVEVLDLHLVVEVLALCAQLLALPLALLVDWLRSERLRSPCGE